MKLPSANEMLLGRLVVCPKVHIFIGGSLANPYNIHLGAAVIEQFRNIRR